MAAPFALRKGEVGKPPSGVIVERMRRKGALVFENEDTSELRQKVQKRIQALDTVRWSWWSNWRELATFIQPRLGRFLETPNEGNRGRPKNTRIIDSTGSTAAQRSAAGLLAGVASPAREWFRLRIGNEELKEGSPGKVWLGQVERRLREVFSESNFYRSLATVFEELVVFGTGVMLIYEDYEDVIRCVPVATGEYYLAVDERLEPAVFGRRIVKTVAELVGEFGLDNVSDGVEAAYLLGDHDTEVMVGHLICPNDERVYDAPGVKGMAWSEYYWENGESSKNFLAIRGYHERPFVAARWNVTGNDAYGRGMGMDAIGDIRQLQMQQRRKAQLIDKLVNPPLVADAVLKNEPASSIPGAVTFLPSANSNVGFKPIYEVKPEGLPAITADIQQTQNRIKTVFFEDLFMMISQLDTTRTATEIVERKEEKMLMLGPALERMHDELLKVTIERVYAILLRHARPLWARGLAAPLPAPPQEIAGKTLGVDFVSTLAQAQKAVATAAIERLLALVGNMVGVFPEARDKIDPDEVVDRYADAIGSPPSIVVSADKVAAVRAQRAKQQAQQSALATGAAAADTGKTLSETEVGGGQNALQRMTGLAA